MEGQLTVPLHFAAEFLTLAVAAGAGLVSVRQWRDGAGRWALAEGAGFFLLAAAQVIHGALLLPADGAAAVVVLRALAFGMLAVWARPRGAVAGAPAIFLVGSDADWALAPALLAAAVAARGLGRRAEGTLAFSAAFAAFSAADLVLVAAPPGGGAVLVLSHAARGAGALLLGRWLWRSVTRSVRLRFAAVVVTVLLAVILVVSLALNQVIASNLEREELERLEITGRAEVEQIIERGTNAQDSAARIASSPAIVTRVDDRAGSLPQDAGVLLSTFAQRVDFLLFTEARGRVLGSAAGSPPKALPRASALSLAGSDVVAEVLNRGRGVSSADSVGGAQVVVIGAAPVRARGDVIGAVAVGVRVDGNLAREIGSDTGSEVSILVGNRAVASTLGESAAVTSAFAPLRSEIRSLRERGGSIRAAISTRGARYLTALVPISRVDGIPVGLLAFSRSSDVLASAQRSINQTLFLVSLAVAALASLMAWALGGRVTEPIRSLTRAAEELRAGNLGARAPVESGDEVGVLGASFNDMAASLDRMTSDLRSAFSTEEELRTRMEAIMQSMGDGLVATDGDGRVVAFNRAAERMVGRKADKAVGKPLSDVLAGRANGRPLAQIAMSGRATEAELERADGTALPVALTSAPLRDASGTTVGRVVVFRDVTRERQAEQMKSEFLANVSHELRTPLTPIRGYTEILRSKKVPQPKAQRFLDEILDSTGRLERIVEMLVDYAAIEAGRLQPRVEAIPVADLVAGALERWRGRDGTHRFVRKVPAGLPPVAADRKLVERCLAELIDNAQKFSPKGGSVEISAAVATDGGKRIRISVRDRGIGIRADKMRSLFQEFRQLDGSETRTYGGLGLGLAYVKRVMGVHRGDVSAQSTPGRGSTFHLDLPLADIPKERPGRAAARPSRGAPRKTARGKKKR